MAQTSIEIEPNTTAAGNLIDDFFETIPSDQRYNRITYERVDPTVLLSASSDKTTFILPKRDFPNCYQLSETLIAVKLLITKKDKTSLPANSKNIATINNSLHSLFRSCELQINDQPINFSNVDFYFYKAYISNLCTFDRNVKLTWLVETNGWTADDSDNWGSNANLGITKRAAFFRENLKTTTNYTNESAFFCGKLYHELFNCDKLIPPWTKVSLSLTRNPDYLYIQHGDSTDTEEYAVVINDLYLLVPTVVLSDPMALELKFKWDKMPIKYNFRTYKTLQQAIIKNQQWRTPSLFNTGDNPIRVYLAIVPNASLTGTYTSSPFEFKRKFTYTAVELYKLNQIKSQFDFEQAFEQFSKKAAREATLQAQQQMSQNFLQLQNMMQLLLQQNNVAIPPPATTSSNTSQRVTRSSAATAMPPSGQEGTSQPSTSLPGSSGLVQQLINAAATEFSSAISQPPRLPTPVESVHSFVSIESESSESSTTTEASFESRHRSGASRRNRLEDPVDPVDPMNPSSNTTTKTLELRKLQLLLANQPLGNSIIIINNFYGLH